MSVTQDEITRFINNTFTLGGEFIITPDLKIRLSSEEDKDITFYDESSKINYIWYTYSPNIKDPDAIICYPFVEHLNKISKDMEYYYNSLSSITVTWIYRIMKTAIRMIVGEVETASEFLEITSSVQGKVDKTTLKEIDTIFNSSINDFGNIFFNKAKGKSTFITGFDDRESTIFSIPKIRVKTKDALVDLIYKLLDVGQDKLISEVYTYTLEKGNVTFPRFESFMNVYIKIWEKLAPCVRLAGDDYLDTVDIVEELKDGLSKAPEMKKHSAWLHPTPIGAKPTKIVHQEQPISNNNSKVIVTGNSGRHAPATTREEQTHYVDNKQHSGVWVPQSARGGYNQDVRQESNYYNNNRQTFGSNSYRQDRYDSRQSDGAYRPGMNYTSVGTQNFYRRNY